jgi:hypothetical protein
METAYEPTIAAQHTVHKCTTAGASRELAEALAKEEHRHPASTKFPAPKAI